MFELQFLRNFSSIPCIVFISSWFLCPVYWFWTLFSCSGFPHLSGILGCHCHLSVRSWEAEWELRVHEQDYGLVWKMDRDTWLFVGDTHMFLSGRESFPRAHQFSWRAILCILLSWEFQFSSSIWGARRQGAGGSVHTACSIFFNFSSFRCILSCPHLCLSCRLPPLSWLSSQNEPSFPPGGGRTVAWLHGWGRYLGHELLLT